MQVSVLARGSGGETGVTLVELVIVLAILAVMAAIAVPNMSQFLREARLSSQTDLLASSLQLARTEAIRQRVNVTVCPMSNPDSGNACSASAADWARGWGVMDPAGTILQRVSVSTGVSVTPAAIAGVQPVAVVFNRSQGSTPQAISLSLCAAGGTQRTVNVFLSGRIGRQLDATACP
ncbi:prepilin-type N-terminal cleavage/methylation domain-containing protein [Aquitalea sp. S1-19]|nr:prepilin-type N-terminal cleavage/methylation domain-containing protein [Aquitalea sp. S1-19]